MPRRYKLGPEGEMRRAWGGKLPEEFDQRDMLAFMAETDLQLQGAVSAETLSAINAAGYVSWYNKVVTPNGKYMIYSNQCKGRCYTCQKQKSMNQNLKRKSYSSI